MGSEGNQVVALCPKVLENRNTHRLIMRHRSETAYSSVRMTGQLKYLCNSSSSISSVERFKLSFQVY